MYASVCYTRPKAPCHILILTIFQATVYYRSQHNYIGIFIYNFGPKQMEFNSYNNIQLICYYCSLLLKSIIDISQKIKIYNLHSLLLCVIMNFGY